MTIQSLPADTKIGYAHLVVANLSRSINFYIDLLGFKEIETKSSTIYLSADGKDPYKIILTENNDAAPQNRKNAGLFHVAVRYPTRQSLSETVKRIAGQNYPISGASDHIVSEAIYLNDPDGSGIEIYTDRPRDKWQLKNGKIAMATLPLDIQDLLAQSRDQDIQESIMPPETDIGHIHLQVTSVENAESFYHQIIGFEVMEDDYQGAIFLAAGGYHHHIGANIWNSKNGNSADENALGLKSFGIEISKPENLLLLRDRITDTGNNLIEPLDLGHYLGFGFKDHDSIQIEFVTPKNNLEPDLLESLLKDPTSV